MQSVVLYFRNTRAAPLSLSWKPYYNLAISLVVGQYTHCELVFVYANFCKAFLFRIGGTVSFHSCDRGYYSNHRLWRGYTIALSERQAAHLLAICETDVANKLSYDPTVHCNMVLPTLLQCRHNTRQSSWCSQHAIDRVRRVNSHIFFDLDAYSTDPNSLELYCRNNPQYFRLVSQ